MLDRKQQLLLDNQPLSTLELHSISYEYIEKRNHIKYKF